MNPVLEFLRALGGKFVVPYLTKKLERFQRQLEDARAIQRALLMEKVRRCAVSDFGRKHRFDEIRTVADFRRNVPVAQYDYYHPYIERVTRGETTAMFPAGERILMFTLSSGTTDAPKLIPVTKTWMNEYRRGWQIWGIRAFLDHPALFYARLAGIAGNWDMRRTPTGIPCGMASGLSARLQSRLLQMVYCIPAAVFELADPAAKYYTSLRLAVPENAGLFLTATPATVVNFSRLGNQYREILLRDVADGTLSREFEIPDPLRRQLQPRISTPQPERARELEQIIERTGTLYPKDYWQLSLVACWLGGTVGTYARRIAEYCGDVPCRDIGLLCSEGRFTIPVEDGTPAGLLEIASHYYEFIPEEEIDSTKPAILECHELEVGKSYFILLTTSSGLYRYNICDVMRCVGYVGQTPVLEFLHKGQRFSDLEGEKLSEFHFVKAVADAVGTLRLSLSTFTAVPVRPEPSDSAGPPYYTIMVEESDIPDPSTARAFLERIDRWLVDHNVMYQGKRSDGYLGPLHLVRIPLGSWAEYDQQEIRRRGVSEDHYKHPCLVLDSEFVRRFRVIDEVVQAKAAVPV